MATPSNILAWRIPWTEEPAGYSPWGRKESDTTKRARTHTHTHTHTNCVGGWVLGWGSLEPLRQKTDT